jgi:hypothetical protein
MAKKKRTASKLFAVRQKKRTAKIFSPTGR